MPPLRTILQAIDDVIGALGEIGEGAYFDCTVLPEELAEKDGGRRCAVGTRSTYMGTLCTLMETLSCRNGNHL